MLGIKDMEKVGRVCCNFSDFCQKEDADCATMLVASLSLFATSLKCVTVPDKNGKRLERMKAMLPDLLEAYNADFPID